MSSPSLAKTLKKNIIPLISKQDGIIDFCIVVTDLFLILWNRPPSIILANMFGWGIHAFFFSMYNFSSACSCGVKGSPLLLELTPVVAARAALSVNLLHINGVTPLMVILEDKYRLEDLEDEGG